MRMTQRIRLIGLPGTGKTTRLLKEIEKFIQRDNFQPSEIIYCSHSNASIKEAKNRLEKGLGDQIKFTTIHSLSKKLLTKKLRKNYLKIMDLTDEVSTNSYRELNILEDFLREIERKYNRKSKYSDRIEFVKDISQQLQRYCSLRNYPLTEDQVEKIINLIWDLNIPSKLSSLEFFHSKDPRIGGAFNDLSKDPFIGFYNLIQIIETAYCIRIDKTNRSKLSEELQRIIIGNTNITYLQIIDVILILHEMIDIFRLDSYSFNEILFDVIKYGLIPKGKILIIDEYQDIGKLQFVISELWSINMNIFIVAGDPNQSIYGFNGVTPEFLEGFEFDKEIILNKSYRLPQEIIAYSMRIVNNFWTKKMESLNPYQGEVLELDMINTINHIIDYEKQYSSIYILCRSDEIKNQMEQYFLEYGLFIGKNRFSSDFHFLNQIFTIFQKLEDKISSNHCTKHDLENFIFDIQQLENEIGYDLTSNFDRQKIGKYYQMVDNSEIKDNLNYKKLSEFNLLNKEQSTSPNPSNGTQILFQEKLSKLKLYQLKRLYSKLLAFYKDIEAQKAGLKELEGLLRIFSEYETKTEINILSLINFEKIENWIRRVKFQNFTNLIRYHHVQSFGLDELFHNIEGIINNGSNQAIQESKLISNFYLELIEKFDENIKALNEIETEIFENLQKFSLNYNQIMKLQKKIKFMTIHAAKGREADLVIIPNISTYYEDRKITDPEENRRVYFVAVTRTKRDLVILSDNFESKKCSFLPKL